MNVKNVRDESRIASGSGSDQNDAWDLRKALAFPISIDVTNTAISPEISHC